MEWLVYHNARERFARTGGHHVATSAGWRLHVRDATMHDSDESVRKWAGLFVADEWMPENILQAA